MGKKKVYEIQGLACANCALKIERELNELPYVKEAVVNAITAKAILEVDNDAKDEFILDDVDRISSSIEHGVKVKEVRKGNFKKKTNNNHHHHKDNCDCGDHCQRRINDNDEEERHEHHHHDHGDECHCGDHCHSHNHDNHEAEENGHDHHHKFSKKAIVIKLLVGLTLGIGANFTENWMKFSLFLVAYLVIGGDILYLAFKNILKGKIFDENFLMSVATIGAFIIGEYPEAIGVMLFYQIGEFLQELAVNKSKKSITALMDIRPDYANLKGEDGEIKVVSPEEIETNDIIIIKPGEKIPLDGVVISGESQVDTSSLTGESVPRIVKNRDSVLAGSINNTALLEVRVTSEYGESTVSKILDLVENASNKKSPTEKFISRFARIYTPIVVFSALALAIIPPIVLNQDFSVWVLRALTFLVVSCPCALVISIPLSYFAGIGGASKEGVLVKGSNYLEALGKVEAVVFDKTGTLTEGTFEVTEIKSNSIITEDMLLEYAAYAEVYSNHPIAKSIIESYKKHSSKPIIDKSRIKSFEEIPGKGVKIYFGDRYVYAGNYKLMDELEIKYKKSKAVGTIVYLAINNNFVGSLVIADKLKETSPRAIQRLKDLGIKKTVMLTGDNKVIANYVGKVVAIDEVHSELLPNEKVEKLEEITKSMNGKGNVVFVGDGINDAPVLTMADVGIAMGGIGSDAAIEASDIVIMTDDPTQISTAIKIARKTQKIVVENIVFSLVIKVLVLVLAAVGIANMWLAVFADVGVTIIAVLNSIRAMKID